MKPMLRTKPLRKVLLILLTVLGLIGFAGWSVASARFLEDYGYVGTLRMLKGQVRYPDDAPIPNAILSITNLGNGKDYAIETDGGGNFVKADLPSGKYKIEVNGTDSNIGEFTVRISQGSPFTSSKYIIIKLSPGCASGDSGLKLVSKINNQ